MWAGLDWLIEDSIANCFHSGIKKKEEVNAERNTCLFFGMANGLLARAG